MKTRKEINRILLIMPPVTISPEYTKEIQPPLGLAYIASCLEKDYETKIIDAAAEGWKNEIAKGGLITYGLAFEELKERINDFKPEVVGVSCLFSMQYRNAHRVCQIVKELDQDTLTIMGGAHPTCLPKETLQDKNVDMVVLGEADFSAKELLDRMRKGQRIYDLDGVAFRENGKIIVNPKTNFIEDLDMVPLPARHLLPMEKYFKINLPHGVSSRFSPNTPIITSRGCPANCIFCSIHSIWGHRYRARSPGNVILELKLLKENYGIREVQFEDDNLTFDKKRAMELFQMMAQEKLDIAWTTPNGVALWTLDRELLLGMRQSGCYRLCLAVESGDQQFLNQTIGKPLDLNKIKELMRPIKELGFETDAFFVVGFPNETRQQLKNTFRFAEQLNTDNVSFYLATPYPGTRLYSICQENDCFREGFALDNLGIKTANIAPNNFSAEELEKMVAYHTLKHKVSLLWRNPRSFYRKVVRRFFKTPRYFITLVAKTGKKLLSKSK